MKNNLLIAVLLLNSTGCVFSEEPLPPPSPEGLFAKKIWDEHVLVETKDAQKSSRILDDFEIVQNITFFPHEGPDITRRDSLIAAVIITIAGSKALDINLTLDRLLDHARIIKAGSLTDQEIIAVKKYFEDTVVSYTPEKRRSIASYNPTLNNFLFGFYKVIKDSTTINEAIDRIRLINCIDITYEASENVDFKYYKKSIDSNIPVLLEKDGEFYIGYGYIYLEGKPHIFYFNPVFVPSLKSPPEMRISDLEENNKSALGYSREGMSLMMYNDYYLSILIPQIHALEPFGKTKFIFHFISGGRPSYKSHYTELRNILKITTNDVKVNYASESESETIWNKYFINNPFKVLGESKIVPCTIVGSKNKKDIPSVYCAMVSVMDTVGSYSSTEFGWYKSSLIRFARRIMERPLEYLPYPEVAALQEILDRKKNEYQKLKNGLENRETSPYYRAAIRLMELTGNTEPIEIKELLVKIAVMTGWIAQAEGAKDLPFEKYQEAFHKHIPIMLYGPRNNNKGEKIIPTKNWFIGIGYFIKDNKNYLILTDISNIEDILHIDDNMLYPEGSIFYEEFDPIRYIPYFIYDWELSDVGIRKELAEIAANHDKYIQQQNQNEIDKYWEIVLSDGTKDNKYSDNDIAMALVAIRQYNDPRVNDIAINWLNSNSKIKEKKAIAILVESEVFDAMPHIREKLKGEMKVFTASVLYNLYSKTSKRDVKDYVYNIRNEIIDALKSDSFYKSGKGANYERRCKEIERIESWSPDDPLAKPESDKNMMKISIDLDLINEAPLYPELGQ